MLDKALSNLGELKDGNNTFAILAMDRYAMVEPDRDEYLMQYICYDFVVWRRRMGLKRLYMTRKHNLKELVTVLSRIANHNAI